MGRVYRMADYRPRPLPPNMPLTVRGLPLKRLNADSEARVTVTTRKEAA